MWLTPKTNWRSFDYYNIEDWQRVRTNLEHLRSWLTAHKMSGPALLSTGGDKGYDELPYVDLVNNMEKNLADLQKIFGTDFTGDVAQKTWYGRLDEMYTSNPTYADWNRWECTRCP